MARLQIFKKCTPRLPCWPRSTTISILMFRKQTIYFNSCTFVVCCFHLQKFIRSAYLASLQLRISHRSGMHIYIISFRYLHNWGIASEQLDNIYIVIATDPFRWMLFLMRNFSFIYLLKFNITFYTCTVPLPVVEDSKISKILRNGNRRYLGLLHSTQTI